MKPCTIVDLKVIKKFMMGVQVADNGQELRILAPFFDLLDSLVGELQVFIASGDLNHGPCSWYPLGLPLGGLVSGPDETLSTAGSDRRT